MHRNQVNLALRVLDSKASISIPFSSYPKAEERDTTIPHLLIKSLKFPSQAKKVQLQTHLKLLSETYIALT